MMSIAIIFVISTYVSSISCYNIVWDNSVEVDFNDIHMYGRMEQLRLPNQFLIFPGDYLIFFPTNKLHTFAGFQENINSLYCRNI